MRPLLGLALAAALACGASQGGQAAADPAPYAAVRELERLQDRIASGDSIAAAAHAAAIARTADLFAKAKPAVWRDVRNARALVLYLFSGGNAAAVAEAVAPELLPKDQQPLYRGALAYGLGDDDKALALLQPIQVKTLPSNLGGHLALVQAMLLAPTDKLTAIEHLDLARLLEPGTLVEEAALRKEMLLIDVKRDDLARFGLLARRYLGSFSHSVYAANFHQLVADAAATAGAGDDASAGARLVQVTGVLPPPERCRLLLRVARDALLAGRLKTSAFASDEAGRLSREGSLEAARAQTYFGAATIVGARYELGRKLLGSVKANLLDERDRALRDSAEAVAEMIRKPSFAAAPAPGETRIAVMTEGERALAASADALKKFTP